MDRYHQGQPISWVGGGVVYATVCKTVYGSSILPLSSNFALVAELSFYLSNRNGAENAGSTPA